MISQKLNNFIKLNVLKDKILVTLRILKFKIACIHLFSIFQYNAFTVSIHMFHILLKVEYLIYNLNSFLSILKRVVY